MSSPAVQSKARPAVPATLAALFDEYAAFSLRVRDLAAETVKARRLYFGRIAACLSAGTPAELLAAFTPKQLMSAVADCASTHGPESRRWFQTTQRSLLRFCHRRGYGDTDLSGWAPSRRRPRLATVPKAVPEEAVARRLAGVDLEEPPGRRDTAIIGLLATYGARGAQIRKLRLSDLDWEAGRVRVGACKRGKEVVLPLTAEAGNRLPEGVSRGTRGFRHAFATRLCGKILLKHISDMLGHRAPSSVLAYAKVDFDSLAQAALPWPEGDAR